MQDIFGVREDLIETYRSFTSSFVDVRDGQIADYVKEQLNAGAQWPDPWLSLNPSFASGGTVDELVATGLLHPECANIFRIKSAEDGTTGRPLTLHRHQRQAVEIATGGKSYVLTTGTGSGKSLSYIVPIVDRVLRDPRPGQISAIVVYPMNALANSQFGELEKFLTRGYPDGRPPVTFERYTGQEDEDKRREILKNPPDILLTNYVMLDLVLTRPAERDRLIEAARGLRFLVLDELHTYRGRQGADVALLVRRVRDACESPDLQCVGTSATMSTEGSDGERKKVVAKVASLIFGSQVTTDRVIGETLVRATTETTPSQADVQAWISPTLPRDTYAGLQSDPLAGWIESTFGVDVENGRLVRRRPTTIERAAADLSNDTALDTTSCVTAVRNVLKTSATATHPENKRPLFAFRLHQFLSKGDTVYVSLEPEGTRRITHKYQWVAPNEPEKILLPLAFCRECGQEYLVVTRSREDGMTRFRRRRDADVSGGDADAGYLYVNTKSPWPTNQSEVLDRIPDSWIVDDPVLGRTVAPGKIANLPTPVWVDIDGTEVGEGHGLRATYLPSPFQFCLTCLTAYEQTRGQDFAKLDTLDAEGRSSAMTVVSAAVLRSLRKFDRDALPDDARKLLTFVDNRQDASLQAGHFNDFVQVAQLRGALYRAAREAGPEGLTHDVLGERVSGLLGLDYADIAKKKAATFGHDVVWRTLREVITYRIYLDLERGWRITMPNLEQTALLRVDYRYLAEIAVHQPLWAEQHPALRDAAAELRAEIGRELLHELRRWLAIELDYLTREGFDRLRARSEANLDGVWALAERDSARDSGLAVPAPGRPGRPRWVVNVTGRSAFGGYLRRHDALKASNGGALGLDDADQIIKDLFAVFEKEGLVCAAAPRGWSGPPGYRIRAEAIVLRPGDGVHPATDAVRRTYRPDTKPRINAFFKDLYRDVSLELTRLQAKEHTAQVDSDRRRERELAFRKGELKLLYCSPTMELGVDISDLSAVGMRNVPPTPANYAQRSGRAGRSHQPALVVTYCANGNSHDQYYFRHQQDMVFGVVKPPRLDLTNPDLIRSHVQAIWLAETGEPLDSSIDRLLVIDEDGDDFPLRPSMQQILNDPNVQRRAVHRAENVLGDLRNALGKDTSWWYESWIGDVLSSAAKTFDDKLDRWRAMYRTARAERARQHRIIGDHSASPEAKRRAVNQRRNAENQIRLLCNEDSDRFQSDFYTYRYLASEGFLPGYSFPRLPLAAFIPGHHQQNADGSYIQRPRFLAINEFGPNALIYHEGARYQVYRAQLPVSGRGDGGLATTEARRCVACGYHNESSDEKCWNCDGRLTETQLDLMQLQTVYTRRRDRISSDEEERRKAGFEVQTSYRFNDAGQSSRLTATVVDHDRAAIADLRYGDAATVRVTNVGRRFRMNRGDHGFMIDTLTGEWLGDKKDPSRTVGDADLTDVSDVKKVARVIPYVEDRRNILVLRFGQALTVRAATSLRYALERGIEAEFQLEDVELSSEPLPDPDDHGRMLFIESAEGGAGVLRRLQGDKDAMRAVARTALKIMHFDPDTGDDEHAGRDKDRCERACYDCLLSYGNQYEHEHIDRHAAVTVIRALAASSTEPSGRTASPTAWVRRLGSVVDELGRQFLEWLRTNHYRLPDAAHEWVEAAHARPDFSYRGSGSAVAVFIDQPPQAYPSMDDRDDDAEERLIDLGWTVIRIGHDEDWEAAVRRHRSVFGAARAGR